jgi:hypothetical protein
MRDFIRREVQEAYDAAVESLCREQSDPEHLQEARKRALLRWLPENRK